MIPLRKYISEKIPMQNLWKPQQQHITHSEHRHWFGEEESYTSQDNSKKKWPLQKSREQEKKEHYQSLGDTHQQTGQLQRQKPLVI